MKTASSADTKYKLEYGYLNKPYTVYQEDIQQVDFDSITAATPSGPYTEYFTLSSKTSSSFSFWATGWNQNPTTPQLYYSIDNGAWVKSNGQIDVPAGSTVRIKSIASRWAAVGYWYGWNSLYIANYAQDGDIVLRGNVMSLLYGDDFMGQEEMPTWCFHNFLYGAWNAVGDISNVVIPVVNDYSCCCMFEQLGYITQGPILLANEVAEGCYQNMFRYCGSLTTAPDLVAKTLKPYCYQEMFQGAGGLSYVKCLATDISAENCINIWISDYGQSGTFVKDPNMTDWQLGVNVPNNFTIINNV